MSKDLHAAIMALPCTPGKLHESMHRAYEFGHRDARNAAAELVIAAPQAQPAVKEAAELSKSELLAMWRDANRIAYVEDDGEAHEFFYRAVLAAQKASQS